MPPRSSSRSIPGPDPDPAGAADEGAVGDDGTSAWPAGTTGPAVGGDTTTSGEGSPETSGAAAPGADDGGTPSPSSEPGAEAPTTLAQVTLPAGSTEAGDVLHLAGEMVSARVMVSGLWGNRAGTKILQRDELVVVSSDDSRLGEGKPLALVEDQAPDPDVAAKLAALAGP